MSLQTAIIGGIRDDGAPRGPVGSRPAAALRASASIGRHARDEAAGTAAAAIP